MARGDGDLFCHGCYRGLLKGSFAPPRPIRDLRDLSRYRRKLTQQIASEKNRLQKILEDGNIKLSSMVNDISGASATKIIDALIEGEEDTDKLLSLCHGRLRSKPQEIALAVKGCLTSPSLLHAECHTKIDQGKTGFDKGNKRRV